MHFFKPLVICVNEPDVQLSLNKDEDGIYPSEVAVSHSVCGEFIHHVYPSKVAL